MPEARFVVSGFLVSIFCAGQAFADQARCGVAQFQMCFKCSEINSAIVWDHPNYGDFLHGLEWNGLFAAYARNCPTIFEKLLKSGADPNSGGWMGSMVYSLSSKFPHDNEKINHRFAEILVEFGARRSTPTSDTGKSAEDIKADTGGRVDYPEIWNMFEE